MKTLLSQVFILTIIAISHAQTGPGGVGNTSSNGLWLRADNINQVNNTDVATWLDGSGNSNDANQITVSLQPNYFSTSALNGMPIVRLDGVDDEMAVDDSPILDNSVGITFYTVLRPNNLNGSPRGILGKRITFTDPAEYAYTWFFHTSNRLNLDVNTQNNRFDTGGTTFSNGVNYILSWDFDGTLPAAQRSRIRSGSTDIVRSTESGTAVSSSNQQVAIGALNVGYGTYLGADYAEIIHFNYALDTVDHILVQNYLSAKYNISIASNDIYTQDDAGNGNYDFDVAGIGQVAGGFVNDDAQGSGIVRILNPSNLNNNEFLIWGHDGGIQQATEFGDVPGTVQARFDRVWRVNEVNGAGVGVDVGSVDVRFDLTGLGPVTAADLRLLVDTDNDGVFSDETTGTGGIISGATALGGSIFEFTNVSSITNNARFTLGTINSGQTPLPIELISFSATAVNNSIVQLDWQTASEHNNDYFTVERSADNNHWESIKKVPGAKNASTVLSYKVVDYTPLFGISYYRLKQTDFDGQFSYSQTKSVVVKKLNDAQILLFPNPAKDQLTVSASRQDLANMQVYDVIGQNVTKQVRFIIDGLTQTTIDLNSLSAGVYFLKTSTTTLKFIKEN
ncbi:MAG: T9SS type A sorting domain-containing protein [Putridiphycobacter sp.]|nr:T9SS type A sorting domain-containing protein [Putridiphycobacter sp.]